jgi:hypothetical protein
MISEKDVVEAKEIAQSNRGKRNNNRRRLRTFFMRCCGK